MKKAIIVSLSLLVSVILGLVVFQTIMSARSEVFWYPATPLLVSSDKPSDPPHPGQSVRAAAVLPAESRLTNRPATATAVKPISTNRPLPAVPPPALTVTNRHFRIMIDAGHVRGKEKDTGPEEEYVMTYKTAKYHKNCSSRTAGSTRKSAGALWTMTDGSSPR